VVARVVVAATVTRQRFARVMNVVVPGFDAQNGYPSRAGRCWPRGWPNG